MLAAEQSARYRATSRHLRHRIQQKQQQQQQQQVASNITAFVFICPKEFVVIVVRISSFSRRRTNRVARSRFGVYDKVKQQETRLGELARPTLAIAYVEQLDPKGE